VLQNDFWADRYRNNLTSQRLTSTIMAGDLDESEMPAAVLMASSNIQEHKARGFEPRTKDQRERNRGTALLLAMQNASDFRGTNEGTDA